MNFDLPPLECSCGKMAKLTRASQGKHEGRPLWECAFAECKTFKWACPQGICVSQRETDDYNARFHPSPSTKNSTDANSTNKKTDTKKSDSDTSNNSVRKNKSALTADDIPVNDHRTSISNENKPAKDDSQVPWHTKKTKTLVDPRRRDDDSRGPSLNSASASDFDSAYDAPKPIPVTKETTGAKDRKNQLEEAASWASSSAHQSRIAEHPPKLNQSNRPLSNPRQNAATKSRIDYDSDDYGDTENVAVSAPSASSLLGFKTGSVGSATRTTPTTATMYTKGPHSNSNDNNNYNRSGRYGAGGSGDGGDGSDGARNAYGDPTTYRRERENVPAPPALPRPEQEFDDVFCDHNLPARFAVCGPNSKPQNRGKAFYACSMDKPSSCGFWKLQDVIAKERGLLSGDAMQLPLPRASRRGESSDSSSCSSSSSSFSSGGANNNGAKPAPNRVGSKAAGPLRVGGVSASLGSGTSMQTRYAILHERIYEAGLATATQEERDSVVPSMRPKPKPDQTRHERKQDLIVTIKTTLYARGYRVYEASMWEQVYHHVDIIARKGDCNEEEHFINVIPTGIIHPYYHSEDYKKENTDKGDGTSKDNISDNNHDHAWVAVHGAASRDMGPVVGSSNTADDSRASAIVFASDDEFLVVPRKALWAYMKSKVDLDSLALPAIFDPLGHRRNYYTTVCSDPFGSSATLLLVSIPDLVANVTPVKNDGASSFFGTQDYTINVSTLIADTASTTNVDNDDVVPPSNEKVEFADSVVAGTHIKVKSGVDVLL